MASQADIRWQQRFSNYRKALGQLEKFIVKGELSHMEEQGLIKAFEYTYELAWTTLKDYLEYHGIYNITGSRDTIREAYQNNLIEAGEGWMKMIVSRKLTAHSYNEATADEISTAVFNEYFDLFKNLESRLQTLRSGGQDQLFEK
jgi:nucleotidyltransferase substrate binding protein (TIGR01987 family)